MYFVILCFSAIRLNNRDSIKDFAPFFILFSGQLSVKNLDYETLNKYRLIVVAFDGKHSAEATVNVIVTDTDDPPHFDRSVFLADVTEDSVENTLVQTLSVTSETSGSHDCDWGTDGVTPEVLSLFTLTTELRSCVVKVRSSDTIKWRKEKPGYEFNIKAINKQNLNEHSITTLKGRDYMYVLLGGREIFWKTE